MIHLPACCLDMDIDLADLIFPLRLSSAGREFVEAHGLGGLSLAEIQANSLDLGEGRIKLFHRCRQLLNDGSCRIYENRPQICREFQCSSRSDCACGGKGFSP